MNARAVPTIVMLGLSSQVALGEGETPSITHWDARFGMLVRGELGGDFQVGEVALEVVSSSDSKFFVGGGTDGDAPLLRYGESFEHKFGLFWGGTLIEGQQSPRNPNFQIRIHHASGACAKFSIRPSLEAWTRGGVTVELGYVELVPECVEQDGLRYMKAEA